MPIRDSAPFMFRPIGLTDSVDQDASFKGACQTIQNLMFCRINRGSVEPRPGVGTAAIAFTSFTSATAVTVQKAVGERIYGMVSSGHFSGHDEPFCYDVSTSAFLTVSGASSANTPTTQATTGAWTPPTMDVVGNAVLVTHPGFTSGNKFGGFDVSGYSASLTATLTSASATLTGTTPTGLQIGYMATGTGIPSNTYVTSFTTAEIILNNAATVATSTTVTLAGGTSAQPLWFAGDLNTNPLPSVATNVSQFFNRAYFSCANTLNYTDVLSPTVRTNASQAITLGDVAPITATSGLPVSTATEGILQALIAFKAPGSGIWQITGDAALSTLVNNQISGSNGTNSPRSVCAVPTGLAYLDSDAARLVTPLGQIVFLNSDIVQPFINSSTPSRACGIYVNSVYRVCLDTVLNGTAVSGADYWYDFLFQRWNGPHTFGYDTASRIGNTSYISQIAAGAKIFASNVMHSSSSVYTDNGATFQCKVQSAEMPLEETMSMKSVIESTVEIVSGQGAQYSVNVQLLDESGNIAGSATVNSQPAAAAWGAVLWGSFSWTASQEFSTPTLIGWSAPVVFSTFSLVFQMIATGGAKIKDWYFRIQRLARTVANQ